MAVVKNSSTNRVKFPEMFPFGSTRGSDITPTTQEGVSLLVMPDTAIGVFNSGDTEITLRLIPVRNDVTRSIRVKIAPNTRWGDFAFNAVGVLNSVGHNSATTEYFTEFE